MICILFGKAFKENIVDKFTNVSVNTFTEYNVFTLDVFNCLDTNETINLFITDFLYPVPSGFELAKAIKSNK